MAKILFKIQHQFCWTNSSSAWVIAVFYFFAFSMIRAEVPDFKFKHINIEEGLSSSEINCIIQDTQGFVWIGTDDGLNRFDGYDVKVYRKESENPFSLVNSVVKTLTIDHQGRLWIGTLKGISRYVRETDSFDSYLLNAENVSSHLVNRVNVIVQNSQHDLYAATENGYFYEYQSEENRFITVNKDKVGVIKDAVVDEDDRFWIATMDQGLCYYDPETDERSTLFMDSQGQKIDSSLTSVLIDGTSLWIGTWREGLVKYDFKTKRFKHYLKGQSDHSFVNQIYRDRKKRVWVGDSYGLLLYRNESDNFHVYHHVKDKPFSLASIGVRCIYEDFQGNFWVASVLGGLNLSTRQKEFRNYSINAKSSMALTKQIVSSVLIDSKNRLWAGYFDGGIDCVDLKSQSRLFFASQSGRTGGLSVGTIHRLFEDKQGQIWAASNQPDLQIYQEASQSFKSVPFFEDFGKMGAGNDVRDIVEDDQGRFWMAVHGKGIVRYHKKTGHLKWYKSHSSNSEKTLIDDWTTSLLFDDRSGLWIATPSGLSCLNTETEEFTNYHYHADDTLSISNSFIMSLYEDNENEIWVGTLDGLNRFNRESKTFERYSKKDGLPGNVINSILGDEQKNLWLATNNGLSRYSKKKNSFRNFDVADGLTASKFMVGSCDEHESGELFFGSIKGITAFFPEEIEDNSLIPPVYLTDIKLFNQSIPVQPEDKDAILTRHISKTDEIHLRHDQNILTFEFVALNFINPEKNRYAYILEGFDETWIDAGFRREVTYTNIDPGEYRFVVKGSNNDGIWNDRGAALRIVIAPPFWEMWWFRFLLFLLVISMIVIMIQWRTRWLSRQNEHLEGLVEDQKAKLIKANQRLLVQERMAALGQLTATVAHEIRNPLGTVRSSVFSIEDAYQQNNGERLLRALSRAERNIVRCDGIITELLDFTRMRDPRLESVEMRAWLENLIQEQNIPGTMVVKPSLSKPFYLEIDKGEVYRAVVNLIDNAVQAMEQREDKAAVNLLTVASVAEEKKYEIIIEDTGSGIAEADKDKIMEPLYSTKTYGVGLGLSIVQKIMTQHHGGVDFVSTPGKGTRFTLWFPVTDFDQSA